MKLDQAKQEFLQLWGTLGSQWGINRTMAQIHALLLIAPESLSAEDVMAELAISRGNANMNLRELMNWNLVYKELKMGERREYFRAEKDIWEVAKRVIQERRRREIQPVKESLKDLVDLDRPKESDESKEFVKVVGDIGKLVNKLDNTADLALKADQNWFFNKLIQIMK
ncbi:MAG: transcriptional regulator [Bacteroidetes bacterium]|nr:transcriptional regulator [Bacteroidota bacterium]